MGGKKCVGHEQVPDGNLTLCARHCLRGAGGAKGGGGRVLRVERRGQRGRELDVGQVRKGPAGVVACWFERRGQLLVWRWKYAAESGVGSESAAANMKSSG